MFLLDIISTAVTIYYDDKILFCLLLFFCFPRFFVVVAGVEGAGDASGRCQDPSARGVPGRADAL